MKFPQIQNHKQDEQLVMKTWSGYPHSGHTPWSEGKNIHISLFVHSRVILSKISHLWYLNIELNWAIVVDNSREATILLLQSYQPVLYHCFKNLPPLFHSLFSICIQASSILISFVSGFISIGDCYSLSFLKNT